MERGVRHTTPASRVLEHGELKLKELLVSNDAAEDGEELQRRGILYAPDYLINAGGIINLSAEIGSPYNPDRAREKTERIYELMGRVIQVSTQEEISTVRAADRIAEDRLASVRSIKTLYRPR